MGVGSLCCEAVVAVVLWPGKPHGAGEQQTSAHSMNVDSKVCSEGCLPRELMLVDDEQGRSRVATSSGEDFPGMKTISVMGEELPGMWGSNRGDCWAAAGEVRRRLRTRQRLGFKR